MSIFLALKIKYEHLITPDQSFPRDHFQPIDARETSLVNCYDRYVYSFYELFALQFVERADGYYRETSWTRLEHVSYAMLCFLQPGLCRRWVRETCVLFQMQEVNKLNNLAAYQFIKLGNKYVISEAMGYFVNMLKARKRQRSLWHKRQE